jgi:hypothetical protein
VHVQLGRGHQHQLGRAVHRQRSLRSIEDREFRRLRPYRLPDLVDSIELRRCTFTECQAPQQRTLANRPTLRNLSLTRCHFAACELGAVIAEDCTIDTIWFHRGIWGPQRIEGCALKHVTIRGNVSGALAIWPPAWWGNHRDVVADPIVVANQLYYQNVDWALDISQARFTGISMQPCDIPTRLIRRDPATQVVVTRDSLATGDWAAACAGSGGWQIAIEDFLASGLPDTVLVASKRGRYFKGELAAIERLRDIGVALAD